MANGQFKPTHQILISELFGKPCKIRIRWATDFIPLPDDWHDLTGASVSHLATNDSELRKHIRAALKDKSRLLFIYVISTLKDYKQSRNQALLARKTRNDIAHVCIRTEGATEYFKSLRHYKAIARFLEPTIYKFE
jgi:hypothetical protein